METVTGARASAAERVARRWQEPPGLRGFLTTVDHKRVGRRYLVTAGVYFTLAGLEAVVFAATAADVHSVVSGGRRVVTAGRHVLGDAGALLSEAIKALR